MKDSLSTSHLCETRFRQGKCYHVRGDCHPEWSGAKSRDLQFSVPSSLLKICHPEQSEGSAVANAGLGAALSSNGENSCSDRCHRPPQTTTLSSRAKSRDLLFQFPSHLISR